MRHKELLISYGVAAALSAAAFAVAYPYVGPAWPKKVVVAAGEDGGALHMLAKEYENALRSRGVKMKIKLSDGSLDAALQVASGEAHVALVNGAAVGSNPGGRLTALASLLYQPVWVFYRGNRDGMAIADLRGKRLAVGAKGGDAWVVTERLLAQSGNDRRSSVLMPLSGENAVKALQVGDIDAVVVLARPSAPLVRRLLTAPNVRLIRFENGSPQARLYPEMARVSIRRGAIARKKNVPARDTALLAPTVNLIARKDLPPALVDLLLGAGKSIHGPAKMIERNGEFPSEQYLAFPQNPEATRYFREGPSFLRRYLPFRVSVFVERMGVMVFPAVWTVALLFLTPIFYRARLRSKINRWTETLAEAEARLRDRCLSDQDKAVLESTLARIERELSGHTVPDCFDRRINRLRHHMRRIRGRIWADQFSAL